MHTLQVLTALTTTCQAAKTGNAIVGSIILLAFIGGILALAIANSRARSQLKAAEAELALLRPENLRLQQWVATSTGRPVHDAYASAYSGESSLSASWHPDPSGRHELRWWDGTKWTNQVSDKGFSSTDPIDG
jgi:hypothetical protein